LDLSGRITLEKGVSLGPGVIIMTHNRYNYNPFLEDRLAHTCGIKDVLIKEGAGIKANALIVHGITIGKNAVVAGNAVVNRDVGDTAVYTIRVTNNGPKDAAGVQVTDILPAGLHYLSDESQGRYDPDSGIWDIGDLSAAAPGNSVSLRISAEAAQPGEIVNLAGISAWQLHDPDLSDNSSGLLINAAAAQSDLAVVQTIEDPFPDAGEPIADIKYVLHLPDGSQREGAVDANGYAREEDIPPGRVRVEFKDLDDLEDQDASGD